VLCVQVWILHRLSSNCSRAAGYLEVEWHCAMLAISRIMGSQ
jgi:hypothetical protein